MSILNGTKITAPVSWGEAYRVLGVARRTTGYDEGYICSNLHGKINVMAKFKPVRLDDLGEITIEQRRSVNCGLAIPSSDNPAVAALRAWMVGYDAPADGPYRNLDFDGYDHSAKFPFLFHDVEMHRNHFPARLSVNRDGTPPTDGEISINDLNGDSLQEGVPYFVVWGASTDSFYVNQAYMDDGGQIVLARSLSALSPTSVLRMRIGSVETKVTPAEEGCDDPDAEDSEDYMDSLWEKYNFSLVIKHKGAYLPLPFLRPQTLKIYPWRYDMESSLIGIAQTSGTTPPTVWSDAHQYMPAYDGQTSHPVSGPPYFKLTGGVGDLWVLYKVTSMEEDVIQIMTMGRKTGNYSVEGAYMQVAQSFGNPTDSFTRAPDGCALTQYHMTGAHTPPTSLGNMPNFTGYEVVTLGPGWQPQWTVQPGGTEYFAVKIGPILGIDKNGTSVGQILVGDKRVTRIRKYFTVANAGMGLGSEGASRHTGTDDIRLQFH